MLICKPKYEKNLLLLFINELALYLNNKAAIAFIGLRFFICLNSNFLLSLYHEEAQIVHK